jgi:cation diffusion facilitator CzcD-associated flavoprotein CzcO
MSVGGPPTAYDQSVNSAVPDHEVLIVGAGFSGIGVAISLQRAGIDDFAIVESGDRFGGTWQWNTYPGVAVDIPSFSYQFSFERRSDWSRVYAPGAELRAYAENCATKYGLHAKARFNVRIDSAAFDEQARIWRLASQAGEELTARHVVDATGVLTHPKRPDIPGVDDFAGATLHTARWDHSQTLAGKRVAVIGTGASAVQVIPAIADEVAHLTVFQRTPIWCLPKYDAPIPPRARWLLGRVPGAGRMARVASQSMVEFAFPIAAHYHRTLPVARLVEKQARAFLKAEVRDPAVRDKLTPRYPLGCKRPSFHNEYLATFNRPDVHLETNPIERIDANAVVTADGQDHAADVLVLATGFKVFEPGNMPAYPVSGMGGADLQSFWSEHRHQAYEGVTVPGFPNYFTMFGPYGYNGSSYFNLIETQARHVVRCLRHAKDRGATLVEVRPEANARYFAEMLRRRNRQVFWQPGCSLANSYYFDVHGDVPLRPVPTLETAWRSRRFPLADYRFA